MKVQLKVIKSDGSMEEYLHTKVIGTISHALASVDESDICVAEQLAEAVTYFLYHKSRDHGGPRNVSSGEIFSVIKASLAATNYEEAAIALSEYHCQRRLKRSRVEVVPVDIKQLCDAEQLCSSDDFAGRSRWDKSIIVAGLIGEHSICRPTARTIASMVEDKVFSMDLTLIPASLINQLVLNDTAKVLSAERALQVV